MGAFLHDLGKTKVPLSILNKQGNLLPEEFAEIKKHPRHGYDLVKLHNLIDSSSSAVVLQHHERINGKGYPHNLRNGQIHRFAKICSIVDVYDALVTDRPYRPALPPHKALEFIEGGGEEFEPAFLQNFYRHIAVYPIGTIVGLSNDVIGIVTHNTAGFPTRPVVRVFWTKDFQKVNPYEIDLKETINLVVNKVFEDKNYLKQYYKVSPRFSILKIWGTYGRKILVVEDTVFYAKLINDALLNLSYTVSAVVTTGEEAIHKAKELNPDLVLMDIILQGKIDGIEAAAIIRRDLDIPVIYLTAFSDVQVLERAKITSRLVF